MGKSGIATLGLMILLALFSCIFTGDPEKVPLAKVGDEILYLEEVESLIPDDLGKEDSLLLAEDYIKKWITAELLIKKAGENLTAAQRDVSRELEEYKNSLITYRYKKELMAEKMDTLVRTEEINDFYNANENNFILANDIIRAVYVKIPLEDSNHSQAIEICKRITGDDLSEIQEFCLRHAETYNLYVNNWVDARIVLQNLPEMPDDPAGYFASGAAIEKNDEKYYHLVYVLAYKLKGSIAPLEYVSENIRDLIINNRKTDFLKKVEEDIYTEGVRNQKFKLYEYESE